MDFIFPLFLSLDFTIICWEDSVGNRTSCGFINFLLRLTAQHVENTEIEIKSLTVCYEIVHVIGLIFFFFKRFS